jgi:transketolase
VRCVSMPSWELFDALTQAERDLVLPPSVSARLAVEAGAAQGWHRYVGAAGDVVSGSRFRKPMDVFKPKAKTFRATPPRQVSA